MVQQDFINPNFLLGNNTAYELYYRFAEKMPVIDFSCMINPDIFQNKPFQSVYDLWLKDDISKKEIIKTFNHNTRYKDSNNTDLSLFTKWGSAIKNCTGSSIYILTHLELARIFDIYELLTADTASNIFKKATEKLKNESFTAFDVLELYNVEKLYLNIDPFTVCDWDIFPSKVIPSFDVTNLLRINNSSSFTAYLTKAEEHLNIEINNYSHLCEALERQHTLFHSNGCKSMYMKLNSQNSTINRDKEDPDKYFSILRKGEELDTYQLNSFVMHLFSFLQDLNTKKDWNQIICNETLNNNTITDYLVSKDNQGTVLASLINTKYNNNSKAFHSEETYRDSFAYYIPNNIHYKTFDEILNNFSQSNYISTLTGYSASAENILSLSRHEYFRRLLCNYIGDQVEKGFIPDDDDLLKMLIENIIYNNIKKHLNY